MGKSLGRTSGSQKEEMTQPPVKFRCGHWTFNPSTADRCPTTRTYLSNCHVCVRHNIFPRYNEIIRRYREQKAPLESLIADKQRIRDASDAHKNPFLVGHMRQLTAARWQLTDIEALERAEVTLAWKAYYVLWPREGP